MKGSTRHSQAIFLIGFSGSGKSSIGKLLADKLNTSFFDTDTLIVRKARKTIPLIFREDGERHFRILERQAIKDVIGRRGKKVVALGGGTFQSRENREMIKRAGVVVYLACSQTELYRRLRDMKDRPLLHGADRESAKDLKSRIKTLLAKRTKHYNQSDMKFSTTGKSVVATVRELKRKLAKLYA